MLHACAARFDVMGNLVKFWVFGHSRQARDWVHARHAAVAMTVGSRRGRRGPSEHGMRCDGTPFRRGFFFSRFCPSKNFLFELPIFVCCKKNPIKRHSKECHR